MSKPDYMPSLASLALQYGTITQRQYHQFSASLPGRQLSTSKEAELLLKQGLATRYQLELLRLIRDYQIIKKKGEAFGRIAVEKGYATEADIKKAMEIQRHAFQNSRMKKLIGDILVDSKTITADQKLYILKEQTLLEQKAGKEVSQGAAKDDAIETDEIGLSTYEKEFLRIKALDEDFSAALLEKGIAGEEDIKKARDVQEKAFEQENTIKILGDIMVNLNMISKEQKEIIFKEQGRWAGEGNTLSVKISEDEMSAWVHVEHNNQDKVRVSDVKKELQRAGIVDGIYPDSFLNCGIATGLKKFPAAKKDYSQTLRDTRNLNLFMDTGLSDTGEKKKGDLLAEESDIATQKPVKNIIGKDSTGISDRDFTIRCGSGSRKSRDGTRIMAAKTGKPWLSVERFLYIHPVIHVLEDVDQRYGPVESFACLKVSGTITGAHPITAGDVSAREIRGGRIEAIGSISTEVGITDAVIRAQGDIRAKYLHNCDIETFGSLYVKNEIFDSNIRCSGKIDSPSCRVVRSRLYAKQGIILGGAGSKRTQPCLVAAGTEHHLFAQIARVINQIQEIKAAFNRLDEKKAGAEQLSRRTFEKMVEVKIFHDRAKQTKQILSKDIKTKQNVYAETRLKNIQRTILNSEKRMDKAVQTLKELNHVKKKHDQSAGVLSEKIERIRPRILKQIRGLEQTLYAYLEWARFQPGRTKIEILGKAFQGTRFMGIWSETILDSNKNNFVVLEKASGPESWEMRMS